MQVEVQVFVVRFKNVVVEAMVKGPLDYVEFRIPEEARGLMVDPYNPENLWFEGEAIGFTGTYGDLVITLEDHLLEVM
jgi:hypothetical protein